MKNVLNFFIQPISEDAQLIRTQFHGMNRTKAMLVTAFLGAIATILQSAGEFFPGVGYAFSPLSTLPILLCAVLSMGTGIAAYLLTCLLLFVTAPAELFIFPFTTGLLGLVTGGVLPCKMKRAWVILLGSLCLFAGIVFLLYILQFPALGPMASSEFQLGVTGIIFFFSIIYSLIWVEIGLFFLKRLKHFFL